ncbi:MAG: metallophosphoesterase family protein [Deltaproteobacteria bacterium]|nr:metallophosphoesterase family protein [Deltaproteobacteria bacterium]
MTRIGIIADVHADVHALQDALRHLDGIGCDSILCAGDVVGYGLFPEETIALLRDRKIVCVRGNHDRWALGDGSPRDPNGDGKPHDASGWSLSKAARRFLLNLPRSWHGLIDDVRVGMCHGTPRSEIEGVFLDQVTGHLLQRWLNLAEADLLIVGHSHEPFRLVSPGGGVVVNPGVLLRAPLGDADEVRMVFDVKKGSFRAIAKPPTGTFGVLELPSRRFTVHLASDGSEVEIPGVAKY